MSEHVPDQQLPAVVTFANDWATDPTSKHHLMRLLAERTDVLWVEASGMRRPAITRGADWQRVGMKLRKMSGGIRQAAPGLSVLSPPSVPLPTNAVARALNARLYRRSINQALRHMNRTANPLLWVYIPTVARYLDQLPARGLVYHCIDRWWAFSDFDGDEMRKCHEILCRRADHVFVSAQDLAPDCTPFTDRVSYVPHGVEWDHFHTAVSQPLARPADLPDTGRPTAGFIGLIDEWVDLELIGRAARANPHADFVLIGASRIPMTALADMPNVKLLGRKPFSELPAYLAGFDVTLIPFHMNELTRAVNPIKLREYLAAGVPLVTVALPELLTFKNRPGIDVVDTADDFVAAVTRRLTAPPTRAERQDLSESMRSEGWGGRLDQMLQQVGHLL